MARGVRGSKVQEIDPLILKIRNFVILNVRSTGSEDRDLSQRQMAVFLIVSTEPDENHTVRGLSRQLNVTKPAITRALDRLETYDLVIREDDPSDGRSVLVKRTSAGAAYLKQLTRFADQSADNESFRDAA